MGEGSRLPLNSASEVFCLFRYPSHVPRDESCWRLHNQIWLLLTLQNWASYLISLRFNFLINFLSLGVVVFTVSS